MSTLDLLGQSLYLAPNFSGHAIAEGLRQIGLEFPLQIQVSKTENLQRSQKRGGKYFWAPHPGLVYVLWSENSTGRKRKISSSQLSGDVFVCADAERFVSVLLSAIVSFRRRELQEVLKRQPQDLSFASELDARRLALKKIHLAAVDKSSLHEREWNSALELWLDIVLSRHQIHLHTVRRKLQEFLSLLTCELDKNSSLANRFHLAQRFVQETYSLAELRAGFSAWLMEMLEEFPGQELWRGDALSPFCRQAAEWMEEHCCEPISVADCAAAIHVNPSYLSRLFKKETGQTPVAYLQKLRIEQARKLLRQNSYGIEELAALCGFGSVEHFHRVFRRQVGLTPATYRRNARRE